MRRLMPIILISAALLSCGDRRPAPVPRPVAYPRIADPGAVYAAVDSLPLRFETNAAATISRPRPGWIDISYPAWHVTVHVTLTPVPAADIDGVTANRTERMALNMADGAAAEEISLTSGQFRAVLLRSPESRATPLQFIATDDSAWVVSGSAFFDNIPPDAPIDSLAPVVGYLERDLRHTLTTISSR